MKAILVIDLPTSCTMCRVKEICKVWIEEIAKFKCFNERLDNCPLKPIIDDIPENETDTYVRGFMDGILNIVDEEGETE